MIRRDTKHTHRGTCQACGAVQAVNIKDGTLAKHGYNVHWGYFSGTCAGSGLKPLEISKVDAEKTIEHLRNTFIPQLRKRVSGLQAGTEFPNWTKSVPEYEGAPSWRRKDVPAKREELTKDEAERQVKSTIWNVQNSITSAGQHADMLVKLIETRHGQPLYPVKREERKVLKAGSRVRIGGKDGWEGTVQKIEGKVAKGCGPYLNGKFLDHAFIKADGGGFASIPVRTIRQDAIIG